MKESKEHNHKESAAGFKSFSLSYLPGTWGFPDVGIPLNNSVQLHQPNCCQAFPKVITVEIMSGKLGPLHDRVLVSAWLLCVSQACLVSTNQEEMLVRRYSFPSLPLHMNLLFCIVHLPGSSVSTTVCSPWTLHMASNFGSNLCRSCTQRR